MKIDSIDIRYFAADFSSVRTVLEHNKTLPWLSVAQSISGNYKIGLNGGDLVSTGKMGAFIAPAFVQQRIIHEPENGFMEFQYCFIDAVVNEIFSLEEIFSFPVTVGSDTGERLYSLLKDAIETSRDKELSDIQKILKHKKNSILILELLLPLATHISGDMENRYIAHTVNYIKKNYLRKITTETITRIANMSKTVFFDKFKEATGTTPVRMITELRLKNAAKLLIYSDKSVQEIANLCGYEDFLYFSKLFKKNFSLSPLHYKDKNKEYGVSESCNLV